MELVRLAKRLVNRSEPLSGEKLKHSRPIRNSSVIQDKEEDGSILLLAPLDQQPNLLVAILAKWTKAPEHKKFELEPIGAFVWNLCDGKHTFEGISKRLREHFKMNRVEADAALLAFLQMLHQRRLITLTFGKEK